MKKRILIDATTIIEKKDGLSQYIISLLDNISVDAFAKFDFAVLVNKGLKRSEFWAVLKDKPFKIVETQIAPIGPKRDLDFFWFFKKNKKTFDLFHSTSNQYPLCLKNGIATVHDITFRKYLDAHKLGKLFLSLVVKNALHKSAAVIAVSNATKNDLVESFELNEGRKNKISVIYEGWEHLKKGENDIEERESEFQYENYLFYVGTTRLHKNIKNLIRAFFLISDKLPSLKLVISGNQTYLDDEDKKNIALINTPQPRIIFTGFVSNSALEQLFRSADAFIFPSLSEGFGIPVLESFYFKIPLLCSNTTSLPEIAGDAALYFNPTDPAEIAAAIIKFYADPKISDTLIAKGNKRLELFSWKKMADETVELYQKVLSCKFANPAKPTTNNTAY